MNKKRIFSAIVAFALMVALLPVHTFAAVITPDETGGIDNVGQGAADGGISGNGMPTGRMPVRLLDFGEVDPNETLEAVGSYDYTPYKTVADWDDYASNYYYNRMDGWEKKVYDRMDEAAKYYLNMNVNVGTYPYDKSVYTITVNLSDLQIYGSQIVDSQNNNLLEDLYSLFLHSNPQYFFLETGIGADFDRISGKLLNAYMLVYDGMVNGAKRRAAINEVDGQIDIALAAAKKASSSQLGQEKAIHDWICKRVAYDDEFYEIIGSAWAASYEELHYTQSAYSVLRSSWPSDKTQHETVCAGYAQAYSLLCNALDIDTITVTSANHQWNQTRLNGNWYIVDCTWDDIDKSSADMYAYYNGYYYAFFNRKTAFVSANDQGGAHVLESYQTKYLPSDMCSVDKILDDGDENGVRCGSVHAASGTAETPGYSTSLRNNMIRVSFSVPKGSEVYYTLNGTQPSVNDNKSYLYKGAFSVSPGTKIRAIAYKRGYKDSKVLQAQATVSIKITYNVNGGTKLSAKQKTKQVSYGAKYGTLVSPKRRNYTFTGWYTKKSGGTRITKNSTVKITKATTLYAHWKKVTVRKAAKPTLRSTKSRQLKITCKKVSGAKGYQIRYSTSSKFAKKATHTVSQTKLTRTLKKLKSGKKYYVQVRAYKLDSAGKKVYGAWSTKVVKKIK